MAKSEHLTRNLEIWINNRDELFDYLRNIIATLTDLDDAAVKIEAYFTNNKPEDIPEPFDNFLDCALKHVDWYRLARIFEEFLGEDLED